jgi:hypothetical protein
LPSTLEEQFDVHITSLEERFFGISYCVFNVDAPCTANPGHLDFDHPRDMILTYFDPRAGMLTADKVTVSDLGYV